MSVMFVPYDTIGRYEFLGRVLNRVGGIRAQVFAIDRYRFNIITNIQTFRPRFAHLVVCGKIYLFVFCFDHLSRLRLEI
jgi:hypothetical protein